MDAKENKNIVKEIVKDLLCVAPNFGKKVTRSIFKKRFKMWKYIHAFRGSSK